MGPVAIRAREITRSYDRRVALRDFSLEVPEGGIFGLLGPNGSGKSTFVAMLAAMERPERGTLEVLGEAPSAHLKGRVGTVFQENTAEPLMTAGEYMRFAGRLFGAGGRDLEVRVVELLGRFGLGDRANDRVGNLSGGMRRRLEVARALLHRPSLLLLDEPTTGVDAGERSLLWDTLREAVPGMTILLATNDLSEADEVASHVAFVRQGTVVASGTPAELKAGLRKESVRVQWAGEPGDLVSRLRSLTGAGEVACQADVTVVTVDDAASFVPRLFDIAPGMIRSIAIAPASLEDAYFQHVGRRSPEDGE